MNMSFLPDSMKQRLEGAAFQTETAGCSGAGIWLFENALVLKMEQTSRESIREHEMMRWLQGKLPVPEVVAFHTDGKTNALLMTRIEGETLSAPAFMKDEALLVRLLAEGLKKLWQVDIQGCPHTVNVERKLAEALARIEAGQVAVEEAEPGTFGKDGFQNPMEVYRYLKAHQPKEEFTFVHGDYCLPNVFAENGELCGYVDLGRSGAGDKWQDIALAVRSLRHNLEDQGKEERYPALYDRFFEELGIEPDEEKIRYYILLDELF